MLEFLFGLLILGVLLSFPAGRFLLGCVAALAFFAFLVVL